MPKFMVYKYTQTGSPVSWDRDPNKLENTNAADVLHPIAIKWKFSHPNYKYAVLKNQLPKYSNANTKENH